MNIRKSSALTWWITSGVCLALVIALVAAGLIWNYSHRYVVPAAQKRDEALQSVAHNPAMIPADGQGQPLPDVQAAVSSAAEDPALGTLTAEVSDIETGKILWQRDAARLRVPASTTKLLTATAASTALDDDQRLETYVVQQTPGELIVVGEGDITLSAQPGKGFFEDSASVQELAQAISGSITGQHIRRIIVDNSVREGDVFNSTWNRADIPGGNVANLDSVMLNAGRLDPLVDDSPRSTHPGADVAQLLAQELSARGIDTSGVSITVQNSTAASEMTQHLQGQAKDFLPQGLTWLGEVQSAPLHTRIRDMLIHSDNLLAEAVGREIADARHQPRTFAGATTATIEQLQQQGIDVRGAVLKDNSGMSTSNRVSAHILDNVLTFHRPTQAGRTQVIDSLPVSAAEGTLLNRYAVGSGAHAAAGWVRAKTGTLSGVNALAGTVTTIQGHVLAFAFLSNGPSTTAARAALDRLANALHNAQ